MNAWIVTLYMTEPDGPGWKHAETHLVHHETRRGALDIVLNSIIDWDFWCDVDKITISADE